MTETKALFNPLFSDFTWEYLNDNNQPTQATMPGYQISRFPVWLADLMEKHLIDHILNERGIKTSYEVDRAELKEQIEIKLWWT